MRSIRILCLTVVRTCPCINPEYLAGLENATPLGRTRYIATAIEGHRIEVKEVTRLDFKHDKVQEDPQVPQMQLI